MNNSKAQLETWKQAIDKFLKEKLKIELHPQKSRVISLSRGIDFVGFRNFYHFRLLRKRNIRKMFVKVTRFKEMAIPKGEILDSFQGWNAYAKWTDSFKLRKNVVKKIYSD